MSTTGPHTALNEFLRIKPVDLDLAQKVAKAMNMDCDPVTGIVTGRSVIKNHRDDGAPVDVDVGERVVLCFEYNFMDHRREQLAAQAAQKEKAPAANANEDLYRVYLGAFAAGLNGQEFRIAESSSTARMWARAAGLADGIQSRGPAKMPNDDVVGQMPEDFSRFCRHLGEAMTGISNSA